MTQLKTKRAMAKKKNNQQVPAARDRIDLRVDPAWLERVERQCERHGINLTNYIKLAVTQLLESHEATDPRSQKKE